MGTLSIILYCKINTWYRHGIFINCIIRTYFIVLSIVAWLSPILFGLRVNKAKCWHLFHKPTAYKQLISMSWSLRIRQGRGTQILWNPQNVLEGSNRCNKRNSWKILEGYVFAGQYVYDCTYTIQSLSGLEQSLVYKTVLCLALSSELAIRCLTGVIYNKPSCLKLLF
jgi:hypothetical protein